MRSGALVVVAGMLVSAVAVADHRSTYGFVTDVHSDRAYGPDVTDHSCAYDVSIPKAVLDHAPDGPHPELLKGATQAFGADANEAGTCYDLEHTWQRVTFDPQHHDHVWIAMPKATGFNFTAWFVTVSAFLLIVPALFRVLFGAQYRRWRAGRFDRRRERNARRYAAISARAHNKPPAPLPRAEVVDRGDRSSE